MSSHQPGAEPMAPFCAALDMDNFLISSEKESPWVEDTQVGNVANNPTSSVKETGFISSSSISDPVLPPIDIDLL